jgi:hypothetical protein
MTERTSHLAGLWIALAISSTSHSNKAGSTIVKGARLTVKGKKVDGSIATISIRNFPHRPTRDVSSLSGNAS